MTNHDPQKVLNRLAGQKANSTTRRDRFSITRRELDALLTLRTRKT